MRKGKVCNWMTSPAVTVTPNMLLSEARQIMDAGRIRALPVVSDNQLLGIVTRRGLLRSDLSVLNCSALYSPIKLKESVIGEIMTINPITTRPDSLIPEAARVLLENKITALPVMDDNKIIGMLTSSDVFRFILAELPLLKKHPTVENYMTDEVVTIYPSTTLLEAHRQMGTKRIRSLPVLDGDRLVGLVTRTDLMGSDPSRLVSRKNQEVSLKVLQQPVSKVMTTDLITIQPDAPLTEAARLMLEHKIHCLPVMDSGCLVGILTESDLFLMVVQLFL
ncbi:MAG TPA: CBS domain-containing protein [Levilinea sp.]|nr:CBS domain-containing protein [Levilinea sp.]